MLLNCGGFDIDCWTTGGSHQEYDESLAGKQYPLPGKKLDGNNSIGGQFSIGLIGGGKDWHSADEAGRKKI